MVTTSREPVKSLGRGGGVARGNLAVMLSLALATPASGLVAAHRTPSQRRRSLARAQAHVPRHAEPPRMVAWRLGQVLAGLDRQAAAALVMERVPPVVAAPTRPRSPPVPQECGRSPTPPPPPGEPPPTEWRRVATGQWRRVPIECNVSPPPPPREAPLTEWFRQYWVHAAFIDAHLAKQEAAYNRDPKRVAFGPEACLRLRRMERWLAVQGGWAAYFYDRRFYDASDLIFYHLRLFVSRWRECWQAAA